MNCHKLTIRSALVTLCLQRIIIKYYRKKINEKFLRPYGSKRLLRRRAYGQFMVIHVIKNIIS